MQHRPACYLVFILECEEERAKPPKQHGDLPPGLLHAAPQLARPHRPATRRARAPRRCLRLLVQPPLGAALWAPSPRCTLLQQWQPCAGRRTRCGAGGGRGRGGPLGAPESRGQQTSRRTTTWLQDQVGCWAGMEIGCRLGVPGLQAAARGGGGGAGRDAVCDGGARQPNALSSGYNRQLQAWRSIHADLPITYRGAKQALSRIVAGRYRSPLHTLQHVSIKH